MKCCICHLPIADKYGCNAEPVVSGGRCCHDCDMRVVLFARIARACPDATLDEVAKVVDVIKQLASRPPHHDQN